MESKSTHGLRLDQLANLLRAAVVKDPKPEDKSPRPDGEGRKSEDGGQKTEDGDS
jgi:hypothetical protein